MGLAAAATRRFLNFSPIFNLFLTYTETLYNSDQQTLTGALRPKAEP
jgi:hypothetical protein